MRPTRFVIALTTPCGVSNAQGDRATFRADIDARRALPLGPGRQALAGAGP